MKYLTSALIGLAAGQVALAQTPKVPFDCYSESQEIYGSRMGKRTSDLMDLTGLNAYSAKLAALSTCQDSRSGLITGIVSVWGDWDEGQKDWTNLKRLNHYGRMSGLYEFDDNSALSAAGLPSIQPGQYLALQKYWFQEAGVDQWEWYMLRKARGEMS